MILTVRVRRVADSLVITLPSKFLKQTIIKENDSVVLDMRGPEEIIVTKEEAWRRKRGDRV